MTTTYRVDWADPDTGHTQILDFGATRIAAMRYARKLAKKIGTAYVIARQGQSDLGQMVYSADWPPYSDGDWPKA